MMSSQEAHPCSGLFAVHYCKITSGIGWIKEGDANIMLFQLHARHRKRKNSIPKLCNGKQTLISHEDKAQAVFVFYSNYHGSVDQQAVTIDLEELQLQQHGLESLDAPITEEVWATTKHLPPDKAPVQMVLQDVFTKFVGHSSRMM